MNRPGDEPTHPRFAAAALMVGISLLLVLLAVSSL